ncbi:nucleotidyl transferase AbiEii/AbiGii toxin family protein [Myxococcus qinghaiensis]|uniref:nucleotidyl transferase AbiEii/AbiGii toxin family protein n=1 Tax=Myxococcus qinghaiensis TaxID=2906758 RepID=UPI0020A7DE3F|nr:nucleotidyl transferase AbiEii/AbiGii toxin family protein [Myxococcus qinghaiensis]MCP3165833.1 nucleotidyl transferase AbiEii/AbiGii toxin family protein [Myxococcus qinghaiensis]
MSTRRYLTGGAFKNALEQRLRRSSKHGDDFSRRRQLLVFHRFLARAAQSFGDAVTLKGGLVLELRLERARTTRDVDLRLTGSPKDLLSRLKQAGQLDLGDFMRFELRLDPSHPEIQTEGLRYDGRRFRAECRIERELFGQPFGVDVAFGDPLVGEPDILDAEDALGFAGIPPPRLRLYPLETHLAEKLHAYTLPRARPNTRVKDLPDLALLGTVRAIEASRLRAAFTRTFTFRKTHSLPFFLPSPPTGWRGPYRAMAEQDDLPWKTLEVLGDAVRGFLDPVLLEDHDATWSPQAWAWRHRK